MTRIHLIRHGRPASTWDGDDLDPGLDETGWRQAQAAAKTLLNLPSHQRPIAVASSPLRRCRQSAEPLAEALGVAVDIDPAVGEIPTPVAIEAPARSAWLRQALAGRWDEIAGDRDYDLWRRDALAAAISRPGWAVFTHFVAINAIVSLICGEDQVTGFHPDHASITTLEMGQGGPSLVERGRQAATGVL